MSSALRRERNAADIRRAGVGRVPEDRGAVGVIGDLAIWENAISERYQEPRFSRAGWLLRARGQGAGAADRNRFIRRPLLRSGAPARSMSGGNVQKLILGRALVNEPRVIVANQPTWGLDVGAVSHIHARCWRRAPQGAVCCDLGRPG
jgi:simple sugar transport system ATP-binding protein